MIHAKVTTAAAPAYPFRLTRHIFNPERQSGPADQHKKFPSYSSSVLDDYKVRLKREMKKKIENSIKFDENEKVGESIT